MYLKQLASSLLPRRVLESWWYLTDSSWRRTYRGTQKQLRERQRLQELAFCQLWTQTGGKVVAGPFAGLTYVRDDAHNPFPQKLLGTYEMELWKIVEEIIGGRYALIVDVGAAEGFYVNGLAMRLPIAAVIAFEAQRKHHDALIQIANSNQLTDRIEVRGLCRPGDLRNALASDLRKLLICDVEGAEDELLDPVEVSALRTCDILVEVHDHLRPGIGRELQRRFADTHDIRVIASVPRTLADLPAGITLDPELALAAMDEARGVPMDWFWMTHR